MGLTVRNMCKIVHELCPNVLIGVQGLVDGNPYDTIGLYCYPDDDSYWGAQEVQSVEIDSDEHLKPVNVTLRVDIDSSIVIDRTKSKKEKNMNQSQNKEPLKLLTLLSYVVGDEDGYDDTWIEIRLGSIGGYDNKYVFVEGFASNLKDEPAMFENYYVDRILYDEPDEGERHMLIQAVKEKKINENNN